ncbi:MAG: cysteine--tRNA ligase, partial [Candidatus Atribacteria bacterium]|nr:cysteine--tRNA ligase [Candidatus Atribacteria bacterium]
YGKLSGQNIEELKEGARVEVDERKKESIDFALWKRKKEGEPAWESPWGEGRPGWHIECSAMSMKYLGKSIDIHTGGSDLIFPHHENEIAQSEAYTNQPFVRYWMHNGYLCLNNQKMSKSLGNIMKVRDISQKYKGEIIRYFILSAHYRSPLNFSEEQLQQAESSLQRLNNIIFNVKHLLKQGKFRKSKDKNDELILEKRKENEQKFIEAMDDDFNTPVALSWLFGFAREVNIYLNSPSTKNKEVLEKILKYYQELGGEILGILKIFDQEENFEQEIKKLIEEREEARKKRDWVESDQIRNKLKEKGILLEDTPEGVRWKKK